MAGENYALLVAVGDYYPKQLNKLPYSRNDVIEFRDVLLKSAFKTENVILMHDDPKGALPARLFPESAKIRKQLSLILAGRDPDDSVIVAFAGHGIQFKGDESSYFCPLDVHLEQKQTLLPFKEIYDAMKACGAKRKLLLVDACRNDPRTSLARSRATVDLESITRPQNLPVPETVLAYFSCAPGQQSFEWPDLKHGVFFHHVLETWKKGINEQEELTLDDLVYHSRKQTEAFVRNTLEATQTPELLGKSAGRWVLREPIAPPTFDAKNGKTAAEAKASQEAWAKYLKSGVEIRNSLGMTLRLIPSGEYPPELSAGHLGRREIERLRQPHRMPRLLVRAVLLRVERVELCLRVQVEGRKDNWREAAAFCMALSRKEGLSPSYVSLGDLIATQPGNGYRLPTEAEWEYACRAGTTTRFWTGDNDDGLPPAGWMGASSGQRTHAVGELRANPFGLFDTHGNVWEWVEDGWDAAYFGQFAEKAAVDPRGPAAASPLRVFRGGSLYDSGSLSRSSHRYANNPETQSFHVGFRIVLPTEAVHPAPE